MDRLPLVLAVLATLTVVATGNVVATELAQDEEETGPPTEQETGDDVLSNGTQATLWADAPDEFLPESEYVARTGAPRDPLHALANGTDVSFREPPASAQRWSRVDRRSLDATGSDVSARPSHVDEDDLADSDDEVVRDAHVSTFGTHPSTVVHASDAPPIRYVASNGTVSGMVDYRVELPDDETVGREPDPDEEGTWTEVEFVLRADRVNATWLRHPDLPDGPVRRVGAAATRTPRLPYGGLEQDPAALELGATIEVEYVEVRTSYRRTCDPPDPPPVPPGTPPGPVPDPDPDPSDCETDRLGPPTEFNHTTTLDVTDRVFGPDRSAAFGPDGDAIATELYRPRAEVGVATFPDGDRGLAVYDPTPWSSLQLAGDGSVAVQTNWRFYTARDQGWTTLYRHDGDGPEAVRSHGVPVHVHAYPSRHEPYVSGGVDRPTVVDTEGRTRATPGLHDDVAVPVAEGSEYQSTDAIAIRYGTLDASAVAVRGIVRGEPVDVSRTREYTVREAELGVETVGANETHTRVRVTLEESATGDPIDLSGTANGGALEGDGRRPGYVAVEDRRVETGAAGTATVWVEGHGHLTASYRPGSWLSVDPSYTPDTAEAYRSPEGVDVTTVYGLLATVLGFFAPVAVAAWAGLKVAALLPGSRGERA